MAKTRTVDPAQLITTAEFKAFARIDTSADDTLIDTLIVGATDFVEKWTQRAFLGQTWVFNERRWPGRIVELPRPPLLSVTSVGYVDQAGDAQTLIVTTDYVVSTNREPGIIEPAWGKTWPELRSETADAITVTYTAGFHASDTDEVPDAIKIAIMMLTAQWYRCSEPSVPEKVNEVPYGFRELLRQWRIESARDRLVDA